MTAETRTNDPRARPCNSKSAAGAVARRKHAVTQADTDAWAKVTRLGGLACLSGVGIPTAPRTPTKGLQLS